ncbi:alpha/beta-hydrolase [Russula earlei]|uniref:Alpha/beta-hydrolase n=1 Tax=Russula earlei TaxID=71964 RepID=A0ACC0U8V4_9AGAM|nr:alpha/beta-hydrolase [Russula earlei]
MTLTLNGIAQATLNIVSFRWKMSNIWFPLPVASLLRRIVNVLSSLSITHPYLLPTPSTDKNSPERTSHWATRIQWWGGRHEAQGHVPWTTIVENGLGDILQASSGNLSVPWFHRSARLSVFRHDEQLSDPTRTEKIHYTPDPSSHPQEPSEPADSANKDNKNLDEIHHLMLNPVLYDPLRTPRYPIVLCHGLYGFDVRGFPSLRMHYWSSVLNILRKTVGAEVIVTAVPATGSIASRAEQLDRYLQMKALGRGINFMAHSMGGLDCRHLIHPSQACELHAEHLGLGRQRLGEKKQVSTVTTQPVPTMSTAAAEATAETPFIASMGSSPSLSSANSFLSLPSSFTTFLLGMFDPPAFANLTTGLPNRNLQPAVAGRTGGMSIWHPLWLPKLVLDGADGGEGHDGLVSVHSARWGEFLGVIEGADHWALRGASGIELGVDLPSAVNDAWGFADWGRFVRALGRFEGRTAGIEKDGGLREEKASEWQDEVRMAEDDTALSEEDGLRSSTDRLSAVFDWLVEQVPAATRSGISFAGDGNEAGGGAGGGAAEKREDATRWNDAARAAPPKRRGEIDLERLYVALARKLYDEGL